MKAKQVIGIIISCIIIFTVGVAGFLGNIITNMIVGDMEGESFLESIMSADSTTGEMLPSEEFVGVVSVVGEIGPTTTDVWAGTGQYDHNRTIEYIDQMISADNNKAILLYIDSPGGTVYESDELYLKLMEYKEKTGRPIWAYFGSQACSGGYYVAMAADKIYANRNGWTGSIGVIVSLLNCEGLYEKLGIEEINVTSGENKAMGSAGSELTEEQREILQSLVDESYDQFVGIVCEGRKMDEERVRELADGRLYSPLQAKENGLLDEISLYEECKQAYMTELGVQDSILFYEPTVEPNSLMSLFYRAISTLKPQSDSQIAKEIMDSKGNGVLMYYAK